MNPSSMFKLMSLKGEFERNHPRFAAFLTNVLSRRLEAGTVLEISIQRPGEEKICTNMRVTESDLQLIQQLKEMAEQK